MTTGNRQQRKPGLHLLLSPASGLYVVYKDKLIHMENLSTSNSTCVAAGAKCRSQLQNPSICGAA